MVALCRSIGGGRDKSGPTTGTGLFSISFINLRYWFLRGWFRIYEIKYLYAVQATHQQVVVTTLH
jgi:hypothetical protein